MSVAPDALSRRLFLVAAVTFDGEFATHGQTYTGTAALRYTW